MTVTIGRRELLAALGAAAAVVWPLAARAQQARKLPTIGFLGADATVCSSWTAAFVARREIVPRLRRLAIIVDVGYSDSVLEMREVRAAARRGAWSDELLTGLGAGGARHVAGTEAEV